MKTLSHLGYVPGFNFLDLSVCEHCLYGKQTQSPHKRVSTQKSETLTLMHSDVCDPLPTLSMGGASYFVTFIDDFSHKVWAYMLKIKDGILLIFQHSVIIVETQIVKKVKCMHFNNGGEYVSKPFQDFCDLKGIKRELIALYNPP